MAVNKNAEREAKLSRDRLRGYQARQSVHGVQVRRRRRDNVIALVGILVIATLATSAQVLYAADQAKHNRPVATAAPKPTQQPTPSATPKPAKPDAAPEGKNVGTVPSSSIAQGRAWTGSLTLNSVKLGISLDGVKAPQATSVFIDLAKKNFFTTTGSTCHRILASTSAKLIQCGSVDGKGSGDTGFTFGPLENVPAGGIYPAGTIAMARGGTPFSQSTQFFITYADTTLDGSTGGYTVFGSVTSGLPEFIKRIGSAGVALVGSNTSDGSPLVPTKITELAVQ